MLYALTIGYALVVGGRDNIFEDKASYGLGVLLLALGAALIAEAGLAFARATARTEDAYHAWLTSWLQARLPSP